MADWQRNSTCGELSEKDEGREVTLNGWVENRRDHGGIFFLDLRDRYGVTQVMASSDSPSGLLDTIKDLPAEAVVALKGKVRLRDPEHINPGRITGAIEVLAQEIEVLSSSKPIPFEIVDKVESSIDTRLRYRYLDLRRRPMLRALEMRSRFSMAMRNYLHEHDFLEVETPILTKATPEGARDYLVPSRVNPGHFYALPQSPQLFKQLLMVGGLDKYYQIARCFRDEDLRADRQPEFTQIDIEMSFVEEKQVLDLVEGMMRHAFHEGFAIDLAPEFPRLTWAEAMAKYGSDKPDLRFGLEITDISALAETSSFKVFSGTVANGGVVRGLRIPGGEKAFSRKGVEALEAVAKEQGAKGMAWCKLAAEKATGPMARFYEGEELAKLTVAMAAQAGDLLVFIADGPRTAAAALGQIRLAVGKELKLINTKEFQFLWVTDFPMFEPAEETGAWGPSHHPFTAPKDWDMAALDTDPGSLVSRAYDLVLNGNEVASGSIRIHKADVQSRIFKFLGIGDEEAQSKFGFLLEGLQYGAPPHGGLALGLDRLVALALGLTSIRDAIAFPKTSSASCLLTGAPSTVTPEQLADLHVKSTPPEKE